jgi:hypothetical protein
LARGLFLALPIPAVPPLGFCATRGLERLDPCLGHLAGRVAIEIEADGSGLEQLLGIRRSAGMQAERATEQLRIVGLSGRLPVRPSVRTTSASG